MLMHNTLDTLRNLKLHGLAAALEEQQAMPQTHALTFEDRLSLLVDRERIYRDNLRKTRLLQQAHLKVAQACLEDINYKAARGLDKRQIATLAGVSTTAVQRALKSVTKVGAGPTG